MQGPEDMPVVMVNLLSFKERADGGNEGMSGLDSYMLYGEKMRKFASSARHICPIAGLLLTESGATPSYRPGSSSWCIPSGVASLP
jgi:hypothetical protein